MAFLDVARKTGLQMREMTGKTVRQTAKKLDNNAEIQKQLRGVDEDIEANSGISNPLKSHEFEKYDAMEEIRDRHTGTWRTVIERTIESHLVPGLAQLTATGLNVLEASKTLLGTSGEVAAQLIKLGELKVSGWQIHRITEMWAMVCKQFSVNSESSIRFEAPVITTITPVSVTEAHLHSTTADLQTVVVKDEIHRVANAYGLDANYLTALLKAAATIHANGKIELATLNELNLSSALGAKLTSGVSTKISAPSHTITDGTGGTITMTGGMINLNPVVPAGIETPVVVLPVTNVTADKWPHETVIRPQYEGVNPHGTNVI